MVINISINKILVFMIYTSIISVLVMFLEYWWNITIFDLVELYLCFSDVFSKASVEYFNR